VISKQKLTQNTNHYLWFVITSQNTFVISKRAQLSLLTGLIILKLVSAAFACYAAYPYY